MKTVRARLPRHIRRLLRAGVPQHNYTREEYVDIAARNARYIALRSVAVNVVKYSDINASGVNVWCVSWTPQGRVGTPANSDAGGDHPPCAPTKIWRKLGTETVDANVGGIAIKNLEISEPGTVYMETV